MTASEKCCSNIVCTPLSWCTRGLYGNRDGITWLWRTIRANQWDNVERQKKDTDQITNHASCHFLFLLCQKCLCVLCLLDFPPTPPLFTMVLLFMQVWNDCCQCMGCTGGKNMNAFVFFFLFLRHWLTFNNNVAVTLQSKSFKRNLMWNSMIKYYFYGSLINFFKSCISSRNTGFSCNRHILTEVTSLCFCFF